mgnify:CR=1 FL=1
MKKIEGSPKNLKQLLQNTKYSIHYYQREYMWQRKHIEELISAVEQGYKACIVFVIKMKGVNSFGPNYDTHPEFGEALIKARDAGVEVLAYDCVVLEDSLMIDRRVSVIL